MNGYSQRKVRKKQVSSSISYKVFLYLKAKTDSLENRGRRKDIWMFGLKKGAESSHPLLDFMLPMWLALGADISFTRERVYRMLAPANPNYNRVVVICFLKFQDKEFVLCSMRHRDVMLDGSTLTFTQDLSAKTI